MRARRRSGRDGPGPQPPIEVPGSPDTVGHVVLDVSGRMNPSSPFYRYKPAVSIDGAPLIELRTGATLIELPAGRHQLAVGVGSDATRRFHYGRTHIEVTVVPQRTTTVYYRAPRTSLSRGAIGFTPQEVSDTLPAAVLIGCAIAAMAIGVLATLF